MNEFGGMFAISCVAVFAPLLVRLPAFAFMPVVGLELVLGVLIGPSAMGLVTNDSTIKFLAEFGLVFLFFQAGTRVQTKRDRAGRTASWRIRLACHLRSRRRLRRRALPIRHGRLAAARRPHFADDGVRHRDPHFAAERRTAQQFRPACPGTRGDRRARSIAIGLGRLGGAKASTASDVLEHRVLRAGLRRRHFAFDPAIQWFFREAGALAWTRRRTAAVARFPARAARVRFSRRQLRHGGGLAAYAAGMAVAVFFSGSGGRALESRLTSFGSGFFIPLFFTASGVAFDLPSLVSSPANIVRLLLFTLAFLLIRIPPLGIYKNALAKSDLPALALLSSTTLPLVVAITYLGGQTGQMTPENASALVGAAIVTVTLFPMLANMVRAPFTGARSNAVVAAFANRIVAWSLGQVPTCSSYCQSPCLKSRETKISISK